MMHKPLGSVLLNMSRTAPKKLKSLVSQTTKPSTSGSETHDAAQRASNGPERDPEPDADAGAAHYARSPEYASPSTMHEAA